MSQYIVRGYLGLAAEEQPQQDDHWNRHTQQPKQNSASHYLSLRLNRCRIHNVIDEAEFQRGEWFVTIPSPMTGVLHRAPWLLRRQGVTLLQDLDGMQIG